MKKSLTAVIVMIFAIFLGFALSYINKSTDISFNRQDIPIRKISEEKRYLLKDYKGRLALFEDNPDKPSVIFKVYTDNLPDMDKFKLREGIYAENYEELLRLIEDYTS